MSEVDINFVDVDTVLSYAGDFGIYQYHLIFLFSFINILSPYHYFGQTFIALVPEYECKTLNGTQNYTADKCFLHVENGSFGAEEKECSSWNYRYDYEYSTIINELNWVCKDDWKAAMGQSMFFVGSVFGSLLFGIYADRKGRLHALVWSNMLAFLGNILTLFSTGIVTYSAFRFIAGAATDTNFVMMYIIVMEYLRPNMRTFGLNICIGIFYCLASMLVPWTAMLLKSWKIFLLALSVPHLFVFAFYFLVPESAQWLVSKGRVEEAINCLKRVARINKRNIDDGILRSFRSYIDTNIKNTKEHKSFLGLLKTPKLRRKTIILIFKSMAMTLCYDAIARNVNGLGYSPFITFTVTSATIFPAALLILFVQDYIGRKALAMGALFISGIFVVAVAIILTTADIFNPITLLSLIVCSRFAVIVAYNSGAQYAVELIPTEVRGQGVSIIHLVGYLATFFSSQILYLSTFWRPLPEIVIGTLLICAAISCLFLPETLNKTLPVTLEEGEVFGENQGVFEFAFSNTNKTESTRDIAKEE